VGRRHGSRGRCGPVPAPRFFDEKNRGRLQQQEAPGRYIGKRSYGKRVVFAQAIGGGGVVKRRRPYGCARPQARSGGRRRQTVRRSRFRPQHVEALVTSSSSCRRHALRLYSEVGGIFNYSSAK